MATYRYDGPKDGSTIRPGPYRFTARHPEMAKASALDIRIEAGRQSDGIEIRLGGRHRGARDRRRA